MPAAVIADPLGIVCTFSDGRQAAFTLADSGFSAQPSAGPKLIADLGTLRFIDDIGNHRYQNPPNTQPASWWEQGTRTLAGDRAALWPARPARSGFPA